MNSRVVILCNVKRECVRFAFVITLHNQRGRIFLSWVRIPWDIAIMLCQPITLKVELIKKFVCMLIYSSIQKHFFFGRGGHHNL